MHFVFLPSLVGRRACSVIFRSGLFGQCQFSGECGHKMNATSPKRTQSIFGVEGESLGESNDKKAVQIILKFIWDFIFFVFILRAFHNVCLNEFIISLYSVTSTFSIPYIHLSIYL